MTTENAPAYADEWGTDWDDEIREFRDGWISMERKWDEAQKEKRDLEDRMIPLARRARNEGWSISLSSILYGRDFRNKGSAGTYMRL